MALTAEQMRLRQGKLTASMVACLMTGNATKIMNAWRELVGDPGYVPDDLSGVWPVQLGSETEALHLRWYERKTGHVLSRQGEVVVHPEYSWAAATLDGFDAADNCVVECKHTGGREPMDTLLKRYMPQMQWQMIVTGARLVRFSVIFGANEPVVEPVRYDAAYAAEIWSRAVAFMDCVERMALPVALAPVAAPTAAVKTYDMTGKNEWAAEAATWLEHRESGAKADAAEKALKALMPADGKSAKGFGVEITRDRAGKMKLREAA